MEMNESVLLVAKAELVAAKNELRRLEQLTLSSELKTERIKALQREIEQAEAVLTTQADS
ncbi:hypothetical protein [uncultured Enterococcus sp.]|uniref:hypothetical protein n=1 Tax=uncultured Enterococcus sp. TaxID=167972 RepID=UPI00258886CB|nr:hypothetical protein [uncultured Enterococcus sp.]